MHFFIVILLVKVNKKQSISLTKMTFSNEDQPILCLR